MPTPDFQAATPHQAQDPARGPAQSPAAATSPAAPAVCAVSPHAARAAQAACADTSLWSQVGRPTHVPIVLCLAALALLAGLLLPVMAIETLVFWEDSYSILVGTLALLTEGHLALGCALLLFSVLFPIAKLVALGLLWFRSLPDAVRERALWWTSVLGKWSMLDVFVVAVTLVLTTATSLATARPRAGLYAFGAAVLLSMLLSLELEHVHERARQRGLGGHVPHPDSPLPGPADRG